MYRAVLNCTVLGIVRGIGNTAQTEEAEAVLQVKLARLKDADSGGWVMRDVVPQKFRNEFEEKRKEWVAMRIRGSEKVRR